MNNLILILVVCFLFSIHCFKTDNVEKEENIPPEKIIEILGLEPLDDECGGYYRETYRSSNLADIEKERSCATLIYHLLIGKEFAKWHRITSDEIFIYNSGSSQFVLLLYPDGTWKEYVLGPNIVQGETPQVIVPAGTWMAEVLTDRSPDSWGLVGVMVCPGFDPADYTGAQKSLPVIEKYPDALHRIKELGLDY